MDPHAENYFHASQYGYVENNPIVRIDPDGRDWYRCDETGSVLHVDGNANTTEVNGYSYRNIGTEYSLYKESVRFDFVQNELSTSIEVTGNLNLEGGQYIPQQFTADDGQVVEFDFSYTTRDGNNADNAIDRDAVSQMITGINEARNDGADIRNVGISATTNGQHSNTSNHYIRNGARAIDIATINSLSVGNLNNANNARVLQTGLNRGAKIRENFGPALQTRNGQPHNVGGHTNHIHFSVNR